MLAWWVSFTLCGSGETSRHSGWTPCGSEVGVDHLACLLHEGGMSLSPLLQRLPSPGSIAVEHVLLTDDEMGQALLQPSHCLGGRTLRLVKLATGQGEFFSLQCGGSCRRLQ